MTETVTIEKQVFESTLHRSMVLQAENEELKDKIERLEKQLKIAVNVLEDIEKAESSTSYMAYCSLQQIKELI